MTTYVFDLSVVVPGKTQKPISPKHTAASANPNFKHLPQSSSEGRCLKRKMPQRSIAQLGTLGRARKRIRHDATGGKTGGAAGRTGRAGRLGSRHKEVG